MLGNPVGGLSGIVLCWRKNDLLCDVFLSLSVRFGAFYQPLLNVFCYAWVGAFTSWSRAPCWMG